MVGRDVQYRGNVRAKIFRRLHLVAGNFRRQNSSAADFQRDFAKWHADIPADADFIERRFKQQSEQRDRRRLTVGARHCANRRLRQVVGKLNFADNRNALRRRRLEQRYLQRHGGRHDYQVDTAQKFIGLLAEANCHARNLHVEIFFGVAECDCRAELFRDACRRNAASCRADNQNIFICQVHCKDSLQHQQPDDAENQSDRPEYEHDFDFRPAAQLEVMM